MKQLQKATKGSWETPEVYPVCVQDVCVHHSSLVSPVLRLHKCKPPREASRRAKGLFLNLQRSANINNILKTHIDDSNISCSVQLPWSRLCEGTKPGLLTFLTFDLRNRHHTLSSLRQCLHWDSRWEPLKVRAGEALETSKGSWVE